MRFLLTDIGHVVESLIDEYGINLTGDAIDLIEGLGYEDVLSVMLACGITIQRMERQIEEQGGTDEEFGRIVQTAIDLRSEMLNITKDEAWSQMMSDDDVFDSSVNIAKRILGYDQERTDS